MISERRFTTLISAIYDAGADFSCWPKAMRLLARTFHAPAVVLGGFSLRPEDRFVVAPQVDPVQNELYASYYHRINPILPRALAAPVGAVRTDTMLIPRREFARCEFFNDFLLPQDCGSMLGGAAYAEKGRQVSVVVQRRREFDDDEVALYQRIVPHLQRAVQLNAKLELLQSKCAASAEMLDRLDKGAFLVDASARVLLVNREAERSMGAIGGLRVVNGTLRARTASDTAKLHGLVAGCAAQGNESGSGGLLLVGRGPDRAPITVSVLPFRSEPTVFSERPAAIIFEFDTDRSVKSASDRVKLRFGLTLAESAFANEIVMGDGIQASADRLGISRSTARTHLLHIFRKTGTNRQAELVRLLSHV